MTKQPETDTLSPSHGLERRFQKPAGKLWLKFQQIFGNIEFSVSEYNYRNWMFSVIGELRSTLELINQGQNSEYFSQIGSNLERMMDELRDISKSDPMTNKVVTEFHRSFARNIKLVMSQLHHFIERESRNDENAYNTAVLLRIQLLELTVAYYSTKSSLDQTGDCCSDPLFDSNKYGSPLERTKEGLSYTSQI